MKKIIYAVLVLATAVPLSATVKVSLLIQQEEMLPAMPVAFSVTVESDRPVDLPVNIWFLGSKADEPSREFLLDAVPTSGGPSSAPVLKENRHVGAGERRVMVFDGDAGDVLFNDARLFFPGEYLVRVVLADGPPVLPLTDERALVSQRVPFRVTLPSKADRAVWEWMLERNGGKGWNGMNFITDQSGLATYVFHHQRESNFLPYVVMALRLEDLGELPALIDEVTRKFPSSPHLDLLKVMAADWLASAASYYAPTDLERALAYADRARLLSEDVALRGRSNQLRARGRRIAAGIEHADALVARAKTATSQ